MVGARASGRRRPAEPDLGMAQRPPQCLERAILQRASGIRLAGILVAIRDLRDDRDGADRRRGIPALSAADPADPLARLADRPVSERLARAPDLLPDAARPYDDRQPGPAHLGRYRPLHLGQPGAVDRADELGRDAVLVSVHPVDPVRHSQHPARRRALFRYSGLHGVCRDLLCGGRHVADASHRQSAGPAAL